MATSALQALMGPAAPFVVFAIAALAWFLLAPTPALAPADSGLLLARPSTATGTQATAPGRRERQRRTILGAFERGEHERATLLAIEHLREFPDDDAVRAALIAAR